MAASVLQDVAPMNPVRSEHPLIRNWWTFLVRGLFAIIFGVLAFAMPQITLFALVVLFGVFALVDGGASIAAGIRALSAKRPSGLLLLQGLISIAAGVLTLAWPGIGAIALLYVIALWAIVIGGSEIVTAFQLRKVIEDEWLLGLSGVLAVLFGVLLVFSPGLGALALVFQIGLFALVYGGILIGLGFRLRSWGGIPGGRGTPRFGSA